MFCVCEMICFCYLLVVTNNVHPKNWFLNVVVGQVSHPQHRRTTTNNCHVYLHHLFGECILGAGSRHSLYIVQASKQQMNELVPSLNRKAKCTRSINAKCSSISARFQCATKRNETSNKDRKTNTKMAHIHRKMDNKILFICSGYI